ncbi:MAG: recombination protein RecR [Epsilonproteobacteria bacterium]|nr:recombination protein RecR [Campylobacterota bacterium]
MKKYGLEKFNNLVDALNTLPTVGKKSALRYAYHMVAKDTFSALKISHAIESAVSAIRKCEICGALSEDEICAICDDESRDASKLCIVEDAKDIFVLEENTEYDGRYFVFESLEDLDMEKLNGILNKGVKEVIFAFTPSLSNDAIIFFLEDKMKDFDLKFTKIAQGVPTGINLENVDMLSLSKALELRVKV